MLTPAMRASSTSAPLVIMEKAVSTQVFVPPFLKRLPFDEETTTGFTLFGVIIVGARPGPDCGSRPWLEARSGVAAATPAAVVICTNWRRLIFFTASSTKSLHAPR